MKTDTQRWRDEHRRFASSLHDIRYVAEEVDELSHPELRRRIDDVHAFLVAQFLPHLRAEDEVPHPLEASRLVDKLEALRERLVYSYFGHAQLESLQEVLYDLHSVIELHLVKAEYVAPFDRRRRRPHPPLQEAAHVVP